MFFFPCDGTWNWSSEFGEVTFCPQGMEIDSASGIVAFDAEP